MNSMTIDRRQSAAHSMHCRRFVRYFHRSYRQHYSYLCCCCRHLFCLILIQEFSKMNCLILGNETSAQLASADWFPANFAVKMYFSLLTWALVAFVRPTLCRSSMRHRQCFSLEFLSDWVLSVRPIEMLPLPVAVFDSLSNRDSLCFPAIAVQRAMRTWSPALHRSVATVVRWNVEPLLPLADTCPFDRCSTVSSTIFDRVSTLCVAAAPVAFERIDLENADTMASIDVWMMTSKRIRCCSPDTGAALLDNFASEWFAVFPPVIRGSERWPHRIHRVTSHLYPPRRLRWSSWSLHLDRMASDMASEPDRIGWHGDRCEAPNQWRPHFSVRPAIPAVCCYANQSNRADRSAHQCPGKWSYRVHRMISISSVRLGAGATYCRSVHPASNQSQCWFCRHSLRRNVLRRPSKTMAIWRVTSDSVGWPRAKSSRTLLCAYPRYWCCNGATIETHWSANGIVSLAHIRSSCAQCPEWNSRRHRWIYSIVSARRRSFRPTTVHPIFVLDCDCSSCGARSKWI